MGCSKPPTHMGFHEAKLDKEDAPFI